MNNTQLRVRMIDQADQAFSAIVEQVDALLDCAHFYAAALNQQHTRSEIIKCDQLLVAVRDLDALLKMTGKQVESWKREEQSALSCLGVELQFLNELVVTIEAIMLFLEREEVPLDRFSLGIVMESYSNLLRCNRLL